MSGPVPPVHMELVYDLREDHSLRQRLPISQLQWEKFSLGKLPTKLSSGHISKVFFVPYEGDWFFHLHDGETARPFLVVGDKLKYVIGKTIRVETVEFQLSTGQVPLISKIWIAP